MSDYSTYTERDTFNNELCALVEEYLQNQDAYPVDTVLAVNAKSMAIELGSKASFAAEWETYPIQSLIRNTEDNSGIEADIDTTYQIASTYFFVR